MIYLLICFLAFTKNYDDPSNSTHTPLVNGQTFTGEWVKHSDDVNVLVMSPKSDQDFTWYADFSPDVFARMFGVLVAN